MKYCPNCGAELPDEANFCPKCGAKQPNVQIEKAVEEPAPQAAPVSAPINQETSPRQRYNDLVKNDEIFKEIVTFRRKKYLFELIFVSFFISWLVVMFTPVAVYNGHNVSSQGIYMLTYPYKVSPYGLIQLDILAGNKALAPGGLSNAFAVVIYAAGFIFLALMTAFPLIKAFTGRGYVLKQYETGKVKELIQESIRPFWAAALLNIFVLAPSINLFMIATDPVYKSGEDPYLFGEIESIPSGFIVVIIVAVLMTAANIAASVVVGNIFSKKLKEYLKNL